MSEYRPTNISSTQMNGHTKYYLPRAIPTQSADFFMRPIILSWFHQIYRDVRKKREPKVFYEIS